jgi:hypothetical protein
MGASDYLKDDENREASKTYIEFQSDEEGQRDAYRLVSRGGQIREGVEDMGDFFGGLIPPLAKHLFEGDSVELMEWLELDEEDWEEYQEQKSE